MLRMPSCSASVSIAAPAESVWHVLAAVVAWPQWLPTVTSVQALDGDPLAVGSRYVVRQPELRPTTWRVTERQPPRRFVWQARSPGLLMIAEHNIEESSRGSCRVTLRYSFSGLLGPLVGRLSRSITERYLSQEVASLKLKAEGRH
jgi:uncharacterized membrane protein